MSSKPTPAGLEDVEAAWHADTRTRGTSRQEYSHQLGAVDTLESGLVGL
jgi:hypothetical protein